MANCSTDFLFNSMLLNWLLFNWIFVEKFCSKVHVELVLGELTWKGVLQLPSQFRLQRCIFFSYRTEGLYQENPFHKANLLSLLFFLTGGKMCSFWKEEIGETKFLSKAGWIAIKFIWSCSADIGGQKSDQSNSWVKKEKRSAPRPIERLTGVNWWRQGFVTTTQKVEGSLVYQWYCE